MRRRCLSMLLAVTVAACAMPRPAAAMDIATYRRLASQSVRELLGGRIEHVEDLLARQERLMQLGVQGCQEFAQAQPKFAPLMALTAADQPAMTRMSVEELEDAWGDEGKRGDGVGMPLSGLGQFSLERDYLDTVVHPATAYVLVRDYRKTGRKQDLERAKGELEEVLEHIKIIEAAQAR
jgi:hypothetical protein